MLGEFPRLALKHRHSLHSKNTLLFSSRHKIMQRNHGNRALFWAAGMCHHASVPRSTAHLGGAFMAATLVVHMPHRQARKGTHTRKSCSPNSLAEARLRGPGQAEMRDSQTLLKMQSRAHQNQPVIEGKNPDHSGHLLAEPPGHPQLCKGTEHKCIPLPKTRGHQSNTRGQS